GGAATPARAALGPDDVAPEESHRWHRLAREVRIDHLARGAGLDGHRLARVRVDHLHPDVSSAAEMHALLVRALAEQRWRDVAYAHHLVDGSAEHRLDVVAHHWNATTRLATRDRVPQRRDRLPRLLDPVGKVLGEG